MNSNVSQQVAAAIRAMGNTFSPDVMKATCALFAPLHQRAPRDGVVRHSDLAYGDDARHRLDVFTSGQRSSEPALVVVFIHGGGFVAGERSPVPDLINDNVPTFFARHGCVGVNATYRLAPQHRWPSGAQDVGRMVGWLREHVADYGGDPERIVLIGHSAGAAHAAAWTFLQALHGPAGPGIGGLVLLSGVYSVNHPEFHTGPPSPNQLAYYGADEAAWPGMATLGHVTPGHPPVFLGVAEYDPYPFAWPSAALYSELMRRDRRTSRMLTLAGHNHVSTTMMINSEVDTLGPELLDFVRSAVALAQTTA